MRWIASVLLLAAASGCPAPAATICDNGDICPADRACGSDGACSRLAPDGGNGDDGATCTNDDLGCETPEGFVAMSTPAGSQPRAFSGTSGTEVYAVGPNSTVLHYTGSAWESQPPLQTLGTLQDVVNFGDELFAPSDAANNVWHRQGGTWTAYSATSQVYSVWGATSTNVRASGRQAGIYHYTGSWSVQAAPMSLQYDMRTIRGAGADTYCAVGGRRIYCDFGTSNDYIAGTAQYVTFSLGGSLGFVVGYDGASKYVWTFPAGTQQPTPTILKQFDDTVNAVWAASDTDVYVGDAVGGIYHYDGTNWTKIGTPSPSPVTGLYGVRLAQGYVIFASSNDSAIWRYLPTGSHP
ncbi:MAG TPA: hypothetical protein VGM90_33880 [Kofleriaceae bacterium]